MKLTQEQIQFIDAYMKKSGIVYADIRFEMTDHVAAALEEREGDFYQNFRHYMAEHKAELWRSDSMFRKIAYKRAWKVLESNVKMPVFWIVAIAINSGAGLLNSYGINIVDLLQMCLLLLSSFIFFYFLYYKIINRRLTSVIDKLLTIFYLGGIIFRVDLLVKHNDILRVLYYSFAIVFMLLLARSLWQLNVKYKKLYHA